MRRDQGPGSADPFVGGLRRSGLVSVLVLHHAANGPCYGNQLMDRIGELTAGAVHRITAAGETERKRLADELAPNLGAIVSTIEMIRHELLESGA